MSTDNNTQAYKVGYEYGYLNSVYGERAKLKRGSKEDYRRDQFVEPSSLVDWQRGYNDFNRFMQQKIQQKLTKTTFPKYGAEGPFSFVYEKGGGKGKRTKKYCNKRSQSKKQKSQSKKQKFQSKKRK